jgi:cyanophycinase-like exopeptidase
VASILFGALSLSVGVTAAVAAPAPGRSLLLAGGALAVCSDLGPGSCAAPPAGATRLPATYRLDEAGIDRALAPALWAAPGAPPREALARMLGDARRALDAAARDATANGAAATDAGALDAATLESAFADVCLADACAEADPRRPWPVLLDAERAAVLAALEQPQAGADGARPTERALPSMSRVPGGVEVLRAFVAEAQARTPGRPKIAVVTASGFDPMDAVDFYVGVFRELGADAVWWPVDAAAAAARFELGDCAALPRLRVERLRLSNREAVFPDLADYQRAHCASQPALMLQVQGVFFAGGDQWRHRQAFVRADDSPNDWLLELQQAQASGRVVVGGTSAGAAVQSGAWMLGNGDVEAAVARAARVAPPPEPGCARGGRCGGVPEDALALWPAGGLKLAEGAIVDTHFSERSRELRLLMAMQAADARWGYGADETSALLVRERDGRREIRAIGESGGWVMRRDPAMRDEVEAWYLVPGATLVIETALASGAVGTDAAGERVRLEVDAGSARATRQRAPLPASAFDRGALRAAAQRLAWRCGEEGHRLPAVPGVAELRCGEGARGWRRADRPARTTTGGEREADASAPAAIRQGVGPLRLRFLRSASP